MRRVTLAGTLTAVCLMALAGPLAAQTGIELRGGVAVGNHTGTAAGLDMLPKPSFDALLVRGLKPGLGLYGGFARTAFGCEEGFCLDRDLTVVGTHGVLGAEISRSIVWLRAGLMFGSTKVGSEGEASDPGLGVQGALGLAVGSGRVRFLPGVSFRRFAASSSLADDHVTALTADLGVRVGFGS